MLKRLRHMHISLATKCLLLFGTAVVFIIGGAMIFPWTRIDGLMEQLNRTPAQILSQRAQLDHELYYAQAMEQNATATQPSFRSALPASMPTAAGGLDPPQFRIVAIPPQRNGNGSTTEPALSSAVNLTPFEQRAMQRFLNDPDTAVFERTYAAPDGGQRYRYAAPLRAEDSCMRCHSMHLEAQAALPTTMPSESGSLEMLGIVSIDMPSQIVAGELLLNRILLLVSGAIVLTLAGVTFYVITSRLILRPVRVLQETAEKVSEGDLDIRSDISSGDEFQQLSETFNTMLTNLKKSTDQLRAVNKSLDLRLGQLAETNVGLYESNRLKNEFLANVSHELRTPLNSILGFADLVQESLKSNPDAKTMRYMQNIVASGRNLLDLINDLLDVAKIEAGKMEIRPEPLSLPDLFEGLVNILKPLTELKNLSIETSIGNDVPIIHTDPAKLQQVLYNFLSNAIKFSPKDARIFLSAYRENEADEVTISVKDQGPGIEGAQHSVIFEKFRQIDGSVTRAHSGTGLGLAISKELTNLLGGTIGVTSEAGQGAQFWIKLPMKIPASQQDLRGRLALT